MLLFNKNPDLLEIKKRELARFQSSFENAVCAITSMVRTLEQINNDIDEKVKEIDIYCEEFLKTKSELELTKGKNEKVIKNFNTLLGE